MVTADVLIGTPPGTPVQLPGVPQSLETLPFQVSEAACAAKGVNATVPARAVPSSSARRRAPPAA